MDQSVSVATLLRKVKVAAVKLALSDALSWVEPELSGYPSGDVPAYRIGRGALRAQDRWARWTDFHISDGDLSATMSTVYLLEPVGSYERLLIGDAGTLSMPMASETVHKVREMFSLEIYAISTTIPRGVISKVVDHVRNMALDWSLELARAGITGDGLSFTPRERERAKEAHITIGTFNGSFNTGDASGVNARINQGSQDSSTNASRGSIFDQIAVATQEGVNDRCDRDRLLQANEAMKNATEQSGFAKAYATFMAIASDHITVYGPLLPPLAVYLSQHWTP